MKYITLRIPLWVVLIIVTVTVALFIGITSTNNLTAQNSLNSPGTYMIVPDGNSFMEYNTRTGMARNVFDVNRTTVNAINDGNP